MTTQQLEELKKFINTSIELANEDYAVDRQYALGKKIAFKMVIAEIEKLEGTK